MTAGLQPVRELIRVHGPRVARVLIDDRPLPRLDALERFARDQNVPEVLRVPRDRLDRTTRGAEHQGVVGFGPHLAFTDFDSIAASPALVAVALDQDPESAELRCDRSFRGRHRRCTNHLW
ncbi:MAG: RNA methyltransferase substrate-binding domain-containing protein [Polyangiaceae bacterium]